jgi:hypothetical protein
VALLATAIICVALLAGSHQGVFSKWGMARRA